MVSWMAAAWGVSRRVVLLQHRIQRLAGEKLGALLGKDDQAAGPGRGCKSARAPGGSKNCAGVQIQAVSSSANCSGDVRRGWAAYSASSRARRRWRISAAAASVNVTIRIWSMEPGFWRVEQPGQAAIHQRARLARARPGDDQHIPARRDGGLLLWRRLAHLASTRWRCGCMIYIKEMRRGKPTKFGNRKPAHRADSGNVPETHINSICNSSGRDASPRRPGGPRSEFILKW